ncbi:hypothetical protein BH10ACT2_BH10ACT2_21360 [soil metagenome]
MNPFSEPPSTPASVVLPDDPRKRHLGRYIVIAIVAVAAIGAAVFVAVRGDDKPAYSLTSAGDATVDVKTIAFTVTTEGFGSEITADGEIDVQKDLAHFTLDLGTDIVGFGGELEMIIDNKGKATFINQSFFDALGIPLDAEWLRMDEAWLAENGQDSVFNGAAIGSPLDAVAIISKAIKTEEIGYDEVNGLKVRHYRATFRGADVLVSNPALESQLDRLDGRIPDEIVYDFYVDDQNVVRRVTYQIDIGPGEITTDIVVTSINEPLSIEVPADVDVVDARDFL